MFKFFFYLNFIFNISYCFNSVYIQHSDGRYTYRNEKGMVCDLVFSEAGWKVSLVLNMGSVSNNWSFETLQIHAGQTADPTTGARALPLYQTTAYEFRDTTHAANLFGLAELGNIYTRIMNPTQDAVEKRVAALEGGVAALLVASGSAATAYAIMNVAQAGDHVVSSPSLYGGTYNLFHYTLAKYGIEVSFVENPDDLDSWRKAIKPNTKAFFGETIANPKNDVLDIEGVAKIAHEFGAPLIVDNLKLPVLGKLGHRRSWLLLSQLMIILSLIFISFTDPKTSLICTAIAAIFIAFSSATQDIVLDAFRIESASKNLQPLD